MLEHLSSEPNIISDSACTATCSCQWHKCNPCYKHFNWKGDKRERMLCLLKASKYGHDVDRLTGGTGKIKRAYINTIKQSLYSYFWYFFYFSFFVFSFLKKKTPDWTELNLYAYWEFSNSAPLWWQRKKKGEKVRDPSKNKN